MASDARKHALLLALGSFAIACGGGGGAGDACTPTTEVCNGLDDDCDGTVDEDNPGGGSACATGLLGVCASGTLQCQDAVLHCVQDAAATAEACDGLDNDCDGTVDEDNPGGGSSCATGLLGVCASGTLQCQGGALQCAQSTLASAEACDGLDNDCNGMVDEDNPGGGSSCATGLPGVCASGTLQCQGGALQCAQSTPASAEACDGLDNDCNGTVDDGCCPNGQALTEAAQVDALSVDLGWTSLGPYTSTQIPITNDLVITGTLTLTSNDITVPATCLTRFDCRHQVGFLLGHGGALPGVVLSNQSASSDYLAVTLTDTTVRLRFIVWDAHPSAYGSVPSVEILARCDGACGANQIKCPRDKVCYWTGYGGEYCRLCETKTKEECGCWTAGGAAGDGTSCSYYLSNDEICGGTCQSGVCQSSRCP